MTSKTPLSDDLLHLALTGTAKEIWNRALSSAWDIMSAPLSPSDAVSQILERDRQLSQLDLLLSGSAWELWLELVTETPRTVQELSSFWQRVLTGKAILVLDGLSLRESPWLLDGAKRRGFTIHDARATTAELPCETNYFARALGFGQRSALEANGGRSARFPSAVTECTNLPWNESLRAVPPNPAVFFWHHWPDERLHQLAEPGDGASILLREAEGHLKSDAFWALVERLTEGRRLVITSDHGYAISALFPDVTDRDQSVWLRDIFKSGRSASAVAGAGVCPWVPPVALSIVNEHGQNWIALGQRKWKSAGGYPTLTHGGLSLLEVAVPYFELSR